MKRLLVLLAACGDPVAPPPVDAVREDVDILWIGAHPDDELYLAPALGSFCADQRCAMLVLTRGERGTCKRPELCGDLVATREAELAASAAVLGMTVEQWDLGDGAASSAADVYAAWSARSGGEPALLARVRDAITARSPQRIFAFDPRHGSSCHADHRAAGALAVLANEPLGVPLFLVETVLGESGGFAPAAEDVAIESFAGGWSYLTRVMEAHATQFTDAEVEAVRGAPTSEQAVYWLDRADVVDPDPRYGCE